MCLYCCWNCLFHLKCGIKAWELVLKLTHEKWYSILLFWMASSLIAKTHSCTDHVFQSCGRQISNSSKQEDLSPQMDEWLAPTIHLWDVKCQRQNICTSSTTRRSRSFLRHGEPPQTKHCWSPEKVLSIELRAVQSWEHLFILTVRLVLAGFFGQIAKKRRGDVNAAIQHSSVFIPTGVLLLTASAVWR